MTTTHPYNLVIGLNRSDRKAVLHLVDTRTDKRWSQTIQTKPEALHDWLAELREPAGSRSLRPLLFAIGRYHSLRLTPNPIQFLTKLYPDISIRFNQSD